MKNKVTSTTVALIIGGVLGTYGITSFVLRDLDASKRGMDTRLLLSFIAVSIFALILVRAYND